jgi:N-acetylneuraminate lyase
MDKQLLTGLIAAPFTPMHEDGSLNLQVIKPYAEFLISRKCVTGIFICGTTGECVFDDRRTQSNSGKVG